MKNICRLICWVIGVSIKGGQYWTPIHYLASQAEWAKRLCRKFLLYNSVDVLAPPAKGLHSWVGSRKQAMYRTWVC